MLLTGLAIGQAIADGDIIFQPYAPERLNPNSIGLRLGEELLEVNSAHIDADGPVEGTRLALGEAGVLLEPSRLYLAKSLERFGSSIYAPIVHGKSNIARAGLFIHANGEMVDLGVVDHFQFQLIPVLPIRVFAGMSLAQVTFWSVSR